MQYYRAAKADIREQELKTQKAEHSKQRFEQRQERLRLAEEQKEADRAARAERAAKAKAAQAEAAASAPANPVADAAADVLKRLKIESSMAQVAVRKAEKQLASHDTAELQAQVAELKVAAAKALQTLEAAQASAPPTPPPAPKPAVAAAPTVDPLKKAKIEAAMLKAQLRKLEKVEAPSGDQTVELEQLRKQLASAEQAINAAAESAPAAPVKPAADDPVKKAKIEAAMLKAHVRKLEKIEAPSSEQSAELEQLRSQLTSAEQAVHAATEHAPAAAVAKPAMDEALKKAKIDLALQRAALKKAEKAEASEAELSELRSAVSTAEAALHAAEASSNKPAPELVRTDKKPVDDALRALKTEVAFARADVRKLERDDNAAADALDSARARLAEAERKLAEWQGQ